MRKNLLQFTSNTPSIKLLWWRSHPNNQCVFCGKIGSHSQFSPKYTHTGEGWLLLFWYNRHSTWTTNRSYLNQPLFGTFRQSPNKCLRAKMAGRRRDVFVLAWLGVLTGRCLADPCQGVTNGNVENPDDPNCESYIRELLEQREIWVARVPEG